MVVKHISEITQEEVGEDDAEGIAIQWLVDAKMGAENFAMRRFTLKRDGYTPLHTHNWEHEVYILSGSGTVTINAVSRSMNIKCFINSS